MRSIIDSVPQREGFEHVFGFKRGFTGWSPGKRALDAKVKLAHWTHHDIRRSVATGLANIGVQPHIVEEGLKHRAGHRRGVAGIYNKSPYEREVRAAMALWSDHVRSIVTGGERKVLAFEKAGAS